jgi:ribosomal protein S8
MGGLQRIHHLCLRMKHAFRARHPRTHVPDTPTNRSIVGIMHREGLLTQVMPGDVRGPFVDICQTVRNSSASGLSGLAGLSGLGSAGQVLDFAQVLTERQRERLEVLKRTRDILGRLHQLMGSDGSKSIPLDQEAWLKITSNQQHSSAGDDRFSDSEMLKAVSVLPSVDLVRIPVLDRQSTTPEDLQNLTWPVDRKLWLDLRFDAQMTPALTDMFLVSRGSRKVYTTVAELDDVLHGRKFNLWKGSDIGAVTFIRASDGQIMSGWDALKRGVGGEVLCIAK